MPPSKMKAIKVVDPGKAEIQEVPVPKLRDDYILVKVNAVALNPTDWKHIHKEVMATPGCTVGNDFAGVVEEVGPKVEKEWKKRDRIAGQTHGVNGSEPEDGCFAEYCVVKGDITLKIEDNTTDEEASTLGVGVNTVGQGLYQSLGLPLPGSGKADEYLLVYGGSTATGSLAIQNIPFVKSLGASEAFDYNDPECGKKIREYTQDKLTKVFDCISEGESPKICCDAVSSKGGVISYLLAAKHERQDVENRHTLAYTVTGESFKYGPKEMPAKPEDFEFAKKFWELSSKLISSAQIAVHPPKVGPDGLKGVLQGLDDIKDGKVSGVKLVYRVSETP
ncbi:hypothetical protein LTR37_003882 [Vermiconidia calcicola]|uniref:Uncharacterized protein n=1 Tax=Vermiconidia calcicola TaxID=1690605 RepID=A0ACC3NNL9_9PEZI|nr:hypothetical protein LTR37_003882 [Vermiconidia calcicola]